MSVELEEVIEVKKDIIKTLEEIKEEELEGEVVDEIVKIIEGLKD